MAEERRIAREQAIEWTREVRMESDEERDRRPKKTRKPKNDGGSGDEAEPKKKRRGKLKKPTSEGDTEEQAVFSDKEDTEKPAKKVIKIWFFCLSDLMSLFLQRVVKKRVVRDDEDEEELARPQKKQLYVTSQLTSSCSC